MLSRDHGFAPRIGTVGSILEHLIPSGRVQPVVSPWPGQAPAVVSTPCQTPAPWHGGKEARCVVIQIDQMRLSFSDGFALKALKATGTITATTIMGGYSRAGSGTARRLLQYLITPLPYRLISIQVDGGSGFKGELEPACQALEIPLLVLPPKNPDTTAASHAPTALRVARSFPSTKGL